MNIENAFCGKSKSCRRTCVNVPAFDLPTSKREFDKLSFAQKVVLKEQHPLTYDRFARPER